MNILLCLSHSIEESDQLRMFHSLGHSVASIGGFIDPAHPHDRKRDPLPEIPMIPVVKDAVDALGTPDNLGAAQTHIPDAILDWLGDDGVLFFHHYLDERLVPQWPRLRDWMRGAAGRRVVWRSVGQSVEWNENNMAPLRSEGLERVAYSPKEANIPGYTQADALIRFWKDPDEWTGWTGHDPTVINVTQHLRQRDPYTNWRFWEEATQGLAHRPLGPGSEVIGGSGELSLAEMKVQLRSARAYLYLGTQPASYTLGLIEALMTGIPTVSIGPAHMQVFPYSPDLFEGHEIVGVGSDEPRDVNTMLRAYLKDEYLAAHMGAKGRARAIELFGIDTIREQWRDYLS